MKQGHWTETSTLALCIALFPPIWAVVAPYFQVSTGSVALICAGLYVAHGNHPKYALPISLGFVLGDVWAVLALRLMAVLPLSGSAALFVTLFVLGGLAVLLAGLAPHRIDTPSWLCGWAIGLTILSPLAADAVLSLAAQIAVAMLAGVWYVGVFVGTVQARLVKWISKEER